LLEQLNRFARVAAGQEDAILCNAKAGTAALAVTLATAYAAEQMRPIRPQDVPSGFDGTKRNNTE